MAGELEGKRIAVFTAPEGVEQVELITPVERLTDAGAMLELVSFGADQVQMMNHLDKADTKPVDVQLDEVDPDRYDGLVLPGGVANPDMARMNADAVAFVRSFFDQGKPVAAICHGPWMLVEANVVRGRRLTSYPSLQTDIRNAGGDWVDEQVVTDNGLVTSRKPDDLQAFCDKAIEEFAEGEHMAPAEQGLAAS
ncbi:MAG TPA: type 1 glutamine amidotransferase domain-containing protein [Actinomycetota bacterium]|nr:type 1 glutamine amidotransferase domain-containing protein [Actinomycetota bacterium]